MKTDLYNAQQNIILALTDIRLALSSANPVESIVLLQILRQLAEIDSRLSEFRVAKKD